MYVRDEALDRRFNGLRQRLPFGRHPDIDPPFRIAPFVVVNIQRYNSS
jgi:hypothetical protein